MTTVEIFIAFKQAERDGYIRNLENYASCIDSCSQCPAGDACEFISKTRKFDDAFDILIRPHLAEFQNIPLSTLRKNYPEYLI
jgi:hypothetical protein